MSDLIQEGKGTILGIPIPAPPAERHVHAAVQVSAEAANAAASPGQSVKSVVEDRFFKLLSDLISKNIKNLPVYLKKNYIWLSVLILIWLVMWISPATLPLWLGKILAWIQATPFAGLVTFLTAANNNTLGKAIYIAVIGGTVIPVVHALASGQWPQLFSNYQQAAGLVRQALNLRKTSNISNLLIYGGFGLAFSNLLTRNNGIDKYFICLLLSWSVFDALAGGTKDTIVRLFCAAYAGVMGILGKSGRPQLKFVTLALSSFAFGVSLNFIPGFFQQQFTEYHGYLFGLALMAGGIIVGLLKGKQNVRQPG